MIALEEDIKRISFLCLTSDYVCVSVHATRAGIWRLLKIIPCSNEMAILALLQCIIV